MCPATVSRISVARAAGWIAFDIAPLAPAANARSSHSPSIRSVRTITLMSSSCSLRLWISAIAASESSPSSTRTTSAPAWVIRAAVVLRGSTYPRS